MALLIQSHLQHYPQLEWYKLSQLILILIKSNWNSVIKIQLKR